MDAEFFLAGMKQKWDEGGGRVLLGDNTRGGEIMLWLIRFQCDPVCISTSLPCVCTYSRPSVYSDPTGAQFVLRPTVRTF
jgi:hypothetical protein